jgi:Ca2+-binding EF-hand superfamily protein
MVVQKSGMMSS